MPGPASYTINDEKIVKRTKHGVSVGGTAPSQKFARASREKNFKTSSCAPGPGAYNTNNFYAGQAKAGSYSFGRRDDRIMQPYSPGPGAYTTTYSQFA
jgi:hypothetical protein